MTFAGDVLLNRVGFGGYPPQFLRGFAIRQIISGTEMFVTLKATAIKYDPDPAIVFRNPQRDSS